MDQTGQRRAQRAAALAAGHARCESRSATLAREPRRVSPGRAARQSGLVAPRAGSRHTSRCHPSASPRPASVAREGGSAGRSTRVNERCPRGRPGQRSPRGAGTPPTLHRGFRRSSAPVLRPGCASERKAGRRIPRGTGTEDPRGGKRSRCGPGDHVAVPTPARAAASWRTRSTSGSAGSHSAPRS